MTELEATPIPVPQDRALSALDMHPLFALALEKNAVDALEKLVSLQERMMAGSAAREFASALAEFQKECPPVRRTSTARVATKSGGEYTYQYAELDEVARTVQPHLHKHGLSYSWDSEILEGGMMKVVCKLRHANGHEVSASFMAPTEAATHAMSAQQRHASALTYGRRQSLIQVLGLTTADPDSDGASTAKVSPEQVLKLEALLEETADAMRARGEDADQLRKRFLTYMRVGTLEEILADHFLRAVQSLEVKRDAKS